MKTVYSFLTISFLVCSSVFAQPDEYKKVSLTIRAGMDFPVGTSNTVGLEPGFTLPLIKGFGGSFDGAYFFTKNYGIGLRYHLFSAKAEDVFIWLIPDDIYVEYTFKEATHVIAPAFFGRWMSENGRWGIPVSIGAGYVNNKISDYKEKIRYALIYDPDHTRPFPDPDRSEYDRVQTDMIINTIGVVLSAGISFHIVPSLAVGVYADGMLASVKKKFPATNLLSGESFTFVFSRKMNRIGISAGINYSF